MVVRKLLLIPLTLILATCTPLSAAQKAQLLSSQHSHHVRTVAAAKPHSARPHVEKPKYTKAQIEAAAAWASAVYLHNYLVAVTEQQRLACGGDLPECYIAQRESKFNPFAVNPGHSGAPYGDPGDPETHASGKWQFMPGTWNGYAGYPYAAAAPVKIQNDKAREVWAGGAGAGNWACC